MFTCYMIILADAFHFKGGLLIHGLSLMFYEIFDLLYVASIAVINGINNLHMLWKEKSYEI